MFLFQGNNLKVEGWHATNNYDQKYASLYHFYLMVILSKNVYRQEVPGTYRQDVQKCLSKCQDFWLGWF